MVKQISTYIFIAFLSAFMISSCSKEENDNSIEDQSSVSANVDEAGLLSQALQHYTASQIEKLTISGYINARDFRFIKSNCTSLQELNLSNVKISSYEGNSGTNEGYNDYYAANEIPLGAFFYWAPVDEGMPSLKKVVLPNNIVAIRRNAFARAYNLTEINIPEGVKCIDFVAFALCKSLQNIVLPSTLGEIGTQAFRDCEKLENVKIQANYPPKLGNDAFGGISNNAKLIVPKGSADAYKKSSWSKYFEISESNN